MKSSWFDLKVFYLRISNYEVDESTPDHLMIKHHALEPDTLLEVKERSGDNFNGSLSSYLRRDRADKRTEEVTYVSTDKIRMTGSTRFDVYHDEDVLFSGILELINDNDNDDGPNDSVKRWKISCLEIVNSDVGFLMDSAASTADVYVAGCFDGSPVILAKTIPIGFIMPKHHHSSMMERPAEMWDDKYVDPFQDESGIGFNGVRYRGKHLHDDEDDDHDELSWFNAGVRVGVGIGLGVTLGVGIGVGLMFRAYKLTLGQLKR